MAQHDWHMAVPQHEEVIALASIESLAHLLDRLARVLVEASLELAIHSRSDLLVEQVRSALESLLLQIFKDRVVNIALRSCKVVQIDSTGAFASAVALPEHIPSGSALARARRMPIVDSLESLRVLHAILSQVTIGTLVALGATVHL